MNSNWIFAVLLFTGLGVIIYLLPTAEERIPAPVVLLDSADSIPAEAYDKVHNFLTLLEMVEDVSPLCKKEARVYGIECIVGCSPEAASFGIDFEECFVFQPCSCHAQKEGIEL